jgi:hypothetical protein
VHDSERADLPRAGIIHNAYHVSTVSFLSKLDWAVSVLRRDSGETSI